jgi:antitoxin component YwqK of YwqJK toxin-antitoxin module
MKILIFLVFCFAIVSCNPDKNGHIDKQKKYAFNDVTVNFVRNTRVTTFIKNGKPISGIVTQNLKNGGKNTWNVEKGLVFKQTMYYPNGQMERMLEMKNGIEHGTFIMFYSDGTKYIEQFYEEGEPSGIWRRWNNKGELMETIEHE